MSERNIEKRRWRDGEGNTYAVEKTARGGKFIVIRYNTGGNRKAARQFAVLGAERTVQKVLDGYATQNGWKEVH